LTLVVPEDERELAVRSRADEIITFEPGSLANLRRVGDEVQRPLVRVARHLLPDRGRVGYEAGGTYEPASYSAMHLYGARVPALLRESFPIAELVPADDTLEQLRAVKTPVEVGRIREACRLAGRSFVAGAARLRPGLRESQVAAGFHAALADGSGDRPEEARVGGFFYCMSGLNAARASAAYARSRGRRVGAGESVLVHCNSFASGYWTDITRTFCIGEPGDSLGRVCEAVFAARSAALDAIRPGAPAASVDEAARRVLWGRGFGPAFKHATGHGVGFGSIDHTARPRIHPCSREVLRPGMVFNVEPAIYLDGVCGVRQCDMVAVTPTGAELLTPFQSSPVELRLPQSA
jgi:Xaa-Pro aminopeptidase